jgi:hypothetical protein
VDHKKKPQSKQPPLPPLPFKEIEAVIGVKLPPEVKAALKSALEEALEDEHEGEAKKLCDFCKTVKTDTRLLFSKTLLQGPLTMQFLTQATGAGSGQQEGLKVMFNTSNAVLMLLLSHMAMARVQRNIIEYWKGRGMSEDAINHTGGALQDVAQFLESEEHKRQALIAKLEKPDAPPVPDAPPDLSKLA